MNLASKFFNVKNELIASNKEIISEIPWFIMCLNTFLYISTTSREEFNSNSSNNIDFMTLSCLVKLGGTRGKSLEDVALKAEHILSNITCFEEL
ncbi:hypothetical protein HZS_3132 [Henneguya salminicola]|nr:hypothetical protein HZS_3132 [Henneguya salminicola]